MTERNSMVPPCSGGLSFPTSTSPIHPATVCPFPFVLARYRCLVSQWARSKYCRHKNSIMSMREAKLQLKMGCPALVDGVVPSYGYQPTLAIGIAITSLFTLLLSLHLVETVWKRTWWTFVFVVGCLG